MSPPEVGEPRLYSQTDMTEPEVHAFATGAAALFTTRAPGKETVNEDSVALIPVNGEGGILAVADGAGGLPNGEEASRAALEALASVVRREIHEEGASLRTAILDGMEAANKAVIDLGSGSATTLAVVELRGRTVRSYHVGDSIILVTGQRGRVKLQTVSHSPVGYALESGLIDEEEAADHEERHLVSNLLGSPEMRIEVGPTIELSLRDTVVVASDGLADNFFLDEILDHVRKGPLKRQARKLIKRCRERMEHPVEGAPTHKDDLSFLIYRAASHSLDVRKGAIR